MYKQWDKIPGMDDLFPTLNFRRNGPDKVDKGPSGLPSPTTPLFSPGVWARALRSPVPRFAGSLQTKVWSVFIQHFCEVSALELKFLRYGRGNRGLRSKSHGQFTEKSRTGAQARWLLCLPSIIRTVSRPPLARPQEIDLQLLKCTVSTETGSAAGDKAYESLNGF